MKAKTTWILVANGTYAYIACNHGPGHGIERDLIGEFHGENLPGREIMSDAPGRAFDSGGQGRHAMEPATDPRRVNQQAFAHELADYLGKASTTHKFDRLVVAAAPQMLGELRHCLPDTVKEKITGELSKDLTQVPVHKLADHLGDVMAL